MTRINEHKREDKKRVLRVVIQSMADNGEKITQQIVADEIKQRKISGLGITTIKNLWKYFKPSIQAYKKGISNEIRLDGDESKSTVSKTETKQNINDNDVEDDALDLGKHIIESHKNILEQHNSRNNADDGFSISEEQQQLIFKRVYSRFLPIFSDDDRVRLHNRFLAKLEDYDSKEKKILCMKPESITDGDVFAKQFSLESQLQSLCNEVSKEV